ncbi:hypothetical protein WJX73_003005 [Symbiochloris irregularis]|uniref:RRM domain-containing protein n=1 Tax=Symbiochloris irregularis TaxID=706552 RepID=A0AAW1PUV5_9CHLO
MNPDEVRTVFITGFPQDVKERELNNLLRFLPGYEASQMHWKNGQAQGFALFSNGATARTAIDSSHNLTFDETTTLRCELARKNMYIKDDQAAKRGRYGAEPQAAPYTAYAPNPAPQQPAYYQPSPVAAPAAMPAGPRAYTNVSNTKDNPPCNTLFIGNLGDTVSESELRNIFGTQPGFCQLKLNRGLKSVTCFVEYTDIASAMAVHASQQGAVLTSSDRGGIRIQFSKNPYGKKRDMAGNYVTTIPGQGPGDYMSQAASGYEPTTVPGEGVKAEGEPDPVA